MNKATGKLHKVLAIKNIGTESRPYHIQNFVIKEDDGSYLFFTAQGNRCDLVPETIGKEMTVFYRVRSTENPKDKEKYFTNLIMEKIEY